MIDGQGDKSVAITRFQLFDHALMIASGVREQHHVADAVPADTRGFDPELFNRIGQIFVRAGQPDPAVEGIVQHVDVDKLAGIEGYAESSMTDDCWEISWATVSPDKQGKGIGSALLDFCLQRIFEEAKKEEAFAMVCTKPSSLYMSKGFQVLFNTERNSGGILYKKLR